MKQMNEKKEERTMIMTDNSHLPPPLNKLTGKVKFVRSDLWPNKYLGFIAYGDEESLVIFVDGYKYNNLTATRSLCERLIKDGPFYQIDNPFAKDGPFYRQRSAGGRKCA